MNRLFIFAIGGTGARIVKSLAMLLASGVVPANGKRFEVVPLLIDPHISNKDLQRTIQLLQRYQNIKAVLPAESGFFNLPVYTLDHFLDATEHMGTGFSYKLEEGSNERFRDYIGFDKMDEPNKVLMDFLFSGKSINKRGEPIGLLDIDMNIGFVGNPNVGSIVLNQFRESEEFKQMANIFSDKDRIFIVSSIFGGTGAAGFPCILKNIRGAKDNPLINSKGNLENAKIGAVTVMPYFNVQASETSPIQVSHFIAKTKAALQYYEKNVTPSVNSMYYIGDQPDKPYENDPGDNGQQNDAHVIELFAALAIIDFMGTDDTLLESKNGRAVNPITKEFGLKENKTDLAFHHLGDQTQEKISFPLSRFMLFRKYLLEDFPQSIERTAWCNTSPDIRKSFLETTFYRNDLQEFLKHYDDWIRELAANRRAFKPLNMHAAPEAFMTGINPEKGWTVKKADYARLNHFLNEKAKGATYAGVPEKMIDLFHKATREFLVRHFMYFKNFNS